MSSLLVLILDLFAHMNFAADNSFVLIDKANDKEGSFLLRRIDYFVVNESNQTHLFTIDQIIWIDIIFVLFITISITFTCVVIQYVFCLLFWNILSRLDLEIVIITGVLYSLQKVIFSRSIYNVAELKWQLKNYQVLSLKLVFAIDKIT